jgi:hypothetical protein
MYAAHRVRQLLARPQQHLLEVGLIALALVVGGTAALNAGRFAPASRDVAPQAVTVPGTKPLPDSAFPPQAQGFLHPPVYVPEAPASMALSQEQANTNAIQERAAAIIAEREARAEELQQQARLMLKDGNWQRAQELTKESEAVRSGAHQ